jgi:hypothetical protein
MADDDVLKEAKEAFELTAEREADNRREALDDLRFARLAEQWPEAVRQQREREGRPCLTVNRLPAFIRQVVNDARQNSPSIKVHPADSQADVRTAEIYNGLIRNIEVSSRAGIAYDTALDFAVTMGFGYFRINTQYASEDTFDLDVVIKRVGNPFSVYGDPYSTEADSSDWNTAFVTELMTKERFRQRYKGADETDWDASGYDGCRMRGAMKTGFLSPSSFSAKRSRRRSFCCRTSRWWTKPSMRRTRRPIMRRASRSRARGPVTDTRSRSVF